MFMFMGLTWSQFNSSNRKTPTSISGSGSSYPASVGVESPTEDSMFSFSWTSSLRKGVLFILISCSILIAIKPLVIEGVLISSDPVYSSDAEGPLLLNSGMVKAQKAEVSIILWSEDGTIPIEVWTHRPMPDWIWAHDEPNSKRGPATLTGQRVIDKTDERILYTWYTTISPILAKKGVQIYLDERISEGIDISGYLSQSNTLPSQWFLLDNMVSIAGYQSNIGRSIMAGEDRINIQLLSRGQDIDGHTVLAIPALLKEF